MERLLTYEFGGNFPPVTGLSMLSLHFLLIFINIFLISANSGTDDLQSSLSMSDRSALESNLWKEDRQAVRKPEDPKTLYPRERHCRAPEISEPTHAYLHDDTTWSLLFSRYTLDAGDELDTWLASQEVHKDTKHEKQVDDPYDILIPLLFPIAFAIFLCFCVFIIPILGGIAFFLIEVAWYLITHAEIKRTGRRAIIMIEKSKRKRNKMLLPDGVNKPPRSQFTLPKFFRLHPEEDVPDELEESDDDQVWLIKGQVSEDSDDYQDDKEAALDDTEIHRKNFKVGQSLSGLQIDDD